MGGKAFLLGCVVGAALAGLGIAVFSAGREPPPARASSRAASMEIHFRALREDLARWRTAQPAPVAMPADVPAGPSDVAPPTPSPERQLRHFATQPTKFDVLQRLCRNHEERLRKKSDWARVKAALTEKWLFSTYSDILRELGRPGFVRATQKGCTFTYALPADWTQHKYYLIFTFVDGLVIEAEAVSYSFREGR